MEFDLLECGHCNYKTSQISKLEKHLKTKHTTKGEESNGHQDRPEDDENISEIEEVLVKTKKKKSAKAPSDRDENKATGDDSNKNSSLEIESNNKCSMCDFVGENPRAVGVHKFRAHKVKSHSNVFDDQQGVEEAPIVVKEIKVEQGPGLKCSKCPFVGQDKMTLKIHDYRIHKSSTGEEQDMASETLFRPNVSQTESGKEFLCSDCPFIGISKKSLAVHQRRAHKPEQVLSSSMSSGEPTPQKVPIQPKSLPSTVDNTATDSKRPKLAESISQVIRDTKGCNVKSPDDTKAATEREVQLDINDNSVKPVTESNQEVTDILETCIKCPACNFMCNSLRSMGEHVAAIHSFKSGDKGGKAVVAVIEKEVEKKAQADCVEADEIKAANIRPTLELEKSDESSQKWKCSLCNKDYSNKANMIRHQRLNHSSSDKVNSSPKVVFPAVTPVKPAKKLFCTQCELTFSHKASFIRHVRKNHSSDVNKNSSWIGGDFEIIQRNKEVKQED